MEKILIFLCLLLLSIVDAQKIDNCEYEMFDKIRFSLSKLRKTTSDYSTTLNRYSYKANFCGPLISQCVTSPDCPAAMYVRGHLFI